MLTVRTSAGAARRLITIPNNPYRVDSRHMGYSGTLRCDASGVSALTLNGWVTGLAFTKRTAIVAVFDLRASAAGMFASIFGLCCHT